MRRIRKFIILILLIFIACNPVYAKGRWKLSQSIDFNLTIAEYVELHLPESINMDVKVGIDSFAEKELFFRTNCPVTILIESTGFNGDNFHLLNKYVLYQLEDLTKEWTSSSKYGPFKVKAGTYYNGKMKVYWQGESFAEDDWQKVLTGDYQDIITVTISY